MTEPATVGTQTGTALCGLFHRIHEAGWANRSAGSKLAPTGLFALVTIDPPEWPELKAAVFGDEDVTIYPGSYIMRTGADDVTSVTEYLSVVGSYQKYFELEREYELWKTDQADLPTAQEFADQPDDSEALYLVHNICGEAFDTTDSGLKAAFDHVAQCDSDKALFILPESEAL